MQIEDKRPESLNLTFTDLPVGSTFFPKRRPDLVCMKVARRADGSSGETSIILATGFYIDDESLHADITPMCLEFYKAPNDCRFRDINIGDCFTLSEYGGTVLMKIIGNGCEPRAMVLLTDGEDGTVTGQAEYISSGAEVFISNISATIV